ncbi:MAG: MarR family winged helix-turn-helix transcriptional regulator [Pseudonocardiaceae bacterium]
MDRDLELADRLAGQLFRLIRTVERTKAQAAAAQGGSLERACFGLLVELADRGPKRMTALAEAVLADPSTVSRQVAQLVDLGYVERQADPEDGRASRLAATERGLAKLAEGRRRRNRMFADVLADWTAEDRERLVHLLQRLNDDFETHRPRLLAHATAAGQETA